MLPRRIRSFPLILIVVGLLSGVLTVGWAADRRDRDRDRDDSSSARQQQSAPASQSGRSEPARQERTQPAAPARAPEASRPAAPQPNPASGASARTQPAAPAANHGWGARAEPRTAQPNPNAGWRTPQSSGSGSQGRTQQTNPYLRYRTQPQDAGSRQPSGDAGRTYRADPNRVPARDRAAARTQYRNEPRQSEQPAQPVRRTYRAQPARPTADAPEAGDRTDDRGTPGRVSRQPRGQGQDDETAQPDRAQGRRSERPAARGAQPPAERQRGNPPVDRTGTLNQRARPYQPRDLGQVPADRRDRRLTVPTARFRGADADRQGRAITPQQQQRTRNSFGAQVREWNRNKPVLQQGRLVRDVVGNPVPRDARVIHRTTNARISVNFRRVSALCGTPNNYYTFMPRHHDDYWDGYWDGYHDGRWDSRWNGRGHVPHRPPVVINFFYGYYWSDPGWFGFYYPGYYPAVYHYWGWTPGWVYPTRVYVSPVEYVYSPPVTPYRYYTPGSYMDERGASRAINEVRDSWLNGDMSLLSRHLTDQLDIQVYFDGEYSYTTSTDDYYAMTADAAATTQTVAMDFDDPIWISTAEVFYTGRHVFYDPDGNQQTVYISYRLRHLGTEWYIVAIGSSLNPIEHHYHDFRSS